MKKSFLPGILFFLALLASPPLWAEVWSAVPQEQAEYTVGMDDVLSISILQPDKFETTVTVSPDGFISFPYIGSVKISGMTLSEIQARIEQELSNGYMKYPVILVSLKECHSRKFYVYGEVNKPGTYSLDDNVTVLRAITMAEGFTKFGSSSRVKVLRTRKDQPGYETIKINLKALMEGKPEADILLQPGDMVVVSEGVF